MYVNSYDLEVNKDDKNYLNEVFEYVLQNSDKTDPLRRHHERCQHNIIPLNSFMKGGSIDLVVNMALAVVEIQTEEDP